MIKLGSTAFPIPRGRRPSPGCYGGLAPVVKPLSFSDKRLRRPPGTG